MTDFDPLKAQREIVAGLNDVFKVIHSRAREAEQRMTEAEADYNAMLKLETFTKDLLTQAQAKLGELTATAEGGDGRAREEQTNRD